MTAPTHADKGSHFPNLGSWTYTPRRLRPGNHRTWSGHLPFAHDLIASLKPRVLVELGTHYGESYFGFCQSVVETDSACRCYAIDTWRGDAHSLEYGDDVYDEVKQYNAEWYSAFSTLLRTTFDESVSLFPDESIDLLHIDGLHTYAAVKHDWETWFSKVSPGGIVILHDTAARHADFGVWKLWEEISPEFESFEFHHYHGLGLIRKPGPRKGDGGVLDYFFIAGNEEAIRRHYVMCADRLDSKADLRIAKEGSGAASVDAGRMMEELQVHMDSGDRAISKLTNSSVPGSLEGEFLPLLLEHAAKSASDWLPVSGKKNTWRASTRDPGCIWPAGFNASEIRFFVAVMACSSQEPRPYAQLFWTGKDRAGLNERLSVRFPLLPDGLPHAYILDLHAGAGPGAVNNLWWHHGQMDAVRFDPIDAPGEFTISVAGFAHQDRLEADGLREALRQPPLRSELSYRYLRGSGVEIGALQSPLALRPDTHVRYVDRLTLAQARAHYPELDSLALVDPSIIADAATLSPVADRSVDFVIANHVLEHLTDPLAALGEWLRVVRPGGYVYVAIPEHTNPLDRLREVTPLDHIVDDFKFRAQRQALDREHYREWVASTRPQMPPDQRAKAESDLVSQGYAIHFHTFSAGTFSGLLQAAEQYFPAERVELRRTYGTPSNEFIAIVRKL